MKISFIETTYLSAKATFEEAEVILLGCPYDGSATFRPGARFGPSAIRKASWGIETYSPYFHKDLESLSIHDMGDLELPLGEKRLSFTLIQRAIQRILSSRKTPVLLGGDHLITLPVLKEVLKVYPDLHLIHLDAHADLREEYLGERLSHSTVMKRIADHLKKGRLLQIGIRSGTEEELKLARKMRSIVPLEMGALRSLEKRLRGKPVYLSLDLDLFDPSLLPGVGTPEPGGITFQQFISLIKEVSKLHIIGFDIVELTPDYDLTQISSITASVILREMILAFGSKLVKGRFTKKER